MRDQSVVRPVRTQTTQIHSLAKVVRNNDRSDRAVAAAGLRMISAIGRPDAVAYLKQEKRVNLLDAEGIHIRYVKFHPADDCEGCFCSVQLGTHRC